MEEVPGSGDSGYFKEFPVLGTKGTAPDVHPRCDPGVGVMDVPGKKWVLVDTFLRRYYSIYDDDRGAVGFVRSVHPDEATTTAAPMPAAAASAPEPRRAAVPMLLGLAAPCLGDRQRKG